jgi:hypothetical protein
MALIVASTAFWNLTSCSFYTGIGGVVDYWIAVRGVVAFSTSCDFIT